MPKQRFMTKRSVRCLVAALGCMYIANGNAQTLFTYGKKSVSKDEFLRAYNKNKSAEANKTQSLRDYLELYGNFKLKVQAADDMRLDTVTQLKSDLENFKRQVADNYMNDDKELKNLLQQAFERSQTDRRVALLSLKLDKSAAPADTLAAYQLMQTVYQELQKGKKIEEIPAGSFSLRWKDLGYVTVFTLPYEYENIVYALPKGGMSKPYRAKNAWHIFRIDDERPSAGRWKIAQILLTYPPGASDAEKAAVAQTADSVYQLIRAGADFAEMVRQYSNDKLTYLAGGELPEFGTGKFDYSFEKEVIGLKNDGDISRPFATAFGVHIIKRISHTPTVTDPNEVNFQYELNQKVLKDNRVLTAKEKFARDIRLKIGYQKLNAVKEADLLRFVDSAVAHDEAYINALPFASKAVIKFAKGQVTAADFLKFAAQNKKNNDVFAGEPNAAIWNRYQDVASMDYYREHLSEYNNDYNFQIQEFRDGNMLFEVMERQVWSKASADSLGLRQYFKEHADQYKWQSSADVLIVNCISEKAATDAQAALLKGTNWRELVETRSYELQADSGRYEIAQLLGEGQAVYPGDKQFSAINKSMDGTASFFQFLKAYPANQPKAFDDARGMVINDYQQVLEKKWLEEMRKKYPIKVNESVFQSMLK